MAEVSILEYGQDIATAEAPPPLPAGEYPATVETVEQKTSQTSGKDYIGVTLRVARDNFPADFDQDGAFEDGVVLSYNRLAMEDNARARYGMRKWCEAIGAKMGKQVDPSEWIGLSCKVKIKHDTWEGEKRAQISGISSL